MNGSLRWSQASELVSLKAVPHSLRGFALAAVSALIACSGVPATGDPEVEGADVAQGGAIGNTGGAPVSGSGGATEAGSGGAEAVGGSGSGSALSDPNCSSGIVNGSGSVCCPASCGTCGGTACEDRPGGEANCCAGPIISSGITCDSASAPCLLADPGNSGTGGADSGGVPQPPEGCSNVEFPIPTNLKVHVITNKHVERPDFDQVAKWYTEEGNVQRFQLHDGDQNQENPNILRPRVEAYAPSWSRTGSNDWHEFSANYYLESWESPWLYAVFQIKTNDASNFIIQGLIDDDGSLKIARRGKGRVNLDDDVFQKPFHLRVRSNGYQFEVYYNCELVLAEDHPQPKLESSKTQYTWRWGLYRQEEEADDTQKGTTTMFVTGPKWD